MMKDVYTTPEVEILKFKAAQAIADVYSELEPSHPEDGDYEG